MNQGEALTWGDVAPTPHKKFIMQIMWHSNIFNLLGTKKSFLILYNQKIHKLGIPIYLHIKMLHYTMWTGCPLLVFTKSVDNDLWGFWLAPLTQNILGYSPFWDGIQNSSLFRDSFKRWNFSGKWSSCTSKHQEGDKIWLVSVYCLVEKNFLSEYTTKS